ncbi:NAD(P)-dependent oxidoreductase [Frateuria defendens]|uniref:NAD(P)-dependent oxidoreductase n=1 Tax=Frateuria defendens TaxID=2219559 RepID=UPI00066FBE3D|nr:NAD(P)-dependent oxidoreductase [Frateuria defendens]
MKLALFGATGHIGHAILDEALARGHEVVAIVRDPARLDRRHEHLHVSRGDVAQPSSWLDAVRDAGAALASLSGRRDGDADSIARNAGVLLEQLPKAGVRRLLWVGGAGSLEAAPGVRVMDDPAFPAEWKPEAQAQGRALDLFRAERALDWTYVSPAALLEDGERSGRYRLGGDQLLVDGEGRSRISVADFAVAVLDQIERDDAGRRRVTAAY